MKSKLMWVFLLCF